MAILISQIWVLLAVIVLGIGLCSNLSFGHEGHHYHRTGSCASAVDVVHAPHKCDHDHGHQHGHHHHHHEEERMGEGKKLPEELAEEEDLKLYGFGSHHGHGHGHDYEHEHHHHHHGSEALELSGVGNL